MYDYAGGTMKLPSAKILLEYRKIYSPHCQISASERKWAYFTKKDGKLIILPLSWQKCLFRGQNRHHEPSLTSLGRGIEIDSDSLSLIDQTRFAERIIRRVWFINELKKHPAALWLAEQRLDCFDLALAQHYGIPTGYMDMSESFDVSCFFATCRVGDDGKWQPCSEGIGVVYLLHTNQIKIGPDTSLPIGLQVLPRPKEQFGWVVNCGIHCNFEDIPGLMILKFEHDKSVSQYFLDKFNNGESLFPPDTMADIAKKILCSTLLPKALTGTVINDLRRQMKNITAEVEDIQAAMIKLLGFNFNDSIEIFTDELQEKAMKEWDERRETFLNHVYITLVPDSSDD